MHLILRLVYLLTPVAECFLCFKTHHADTWNAALGMRQGYLVIDKLVIKINITRICRCITIIYTADAAPVYRAETHGTWLARSVYHAVCKLECLEFLTRRTYSGHLSMGAEATIYEIDEFGSTSTYIAYQEEKLPELLDYLKGVMQEFYGTETVEYTFLEDKVKAIYDEDRKIATIYNVFALIAIIVSCLGLFGIALFDIRQRYREIAIRKVNGAGMKDLYHLLFKKYLTVLGASFVVSVPLAYYLIHQYTADFVVKAPIGIGIFVLALLLVAVISMGTLYWQIHKAANIDPATVMKTE